MANEYSGTTSASAEWYAKQKPYSGRKKTAIALFWTAASLVIMVGLAAVPRPTTTNIGARTVQVPPALQQSALAVLRSQGYACDQVQNSSIWISEPGFTLNCPRWDFLFYENGGRWKIVPKGL